MMMLKWLVGQIKKWRLKKNLPFYVALAHVDDHQFYSRSRPTFMPALIEASRRVVDFLKRRQPIGWIERRVFVSTFQGYIPAETTHERAFADWLHTCWLAEQYPNTGITAQYQPLFTAALRARCAERETALLDEFLSAIPNYDDIEWFENYANEEEALYQVKLMAAVEFYKIEMNWRLEAAEQRLRELCISAGIDFGVDSFVENADDSEGIEEDDRDEYEKDVDEYIELTYGLH